MNGRAFAGIHPAVQFLFFTSVMLFPMFVPHPVMLAISLVCSLVYALYTGARPARKSLLRLILPAALLIGIINPLFDHAGVTILFYLPSGNPFTLESVVYGVATGCIFSSVMLWCVSMRFTMTSDRMIYLFGRFTPKLGLLLSMIIRFVPQLVSQFRQVRSARRCLGKDIGQGNLFRRISNFAGIVSSVIGWSLEHSLMTADSMKSRGYGTGRRTSFSLFRFEKRDAVFLCVMVMLTAACTAGCICGTADFWYFPAISPVSNGITDTVSYISLAALCLMPLVTDLKEARKWTAIR